MPSPSNTEIPSRRGRSLLRAPLPPTLLGIALVLQISLYVWLPVVTLIGDLGRWLGAAPIIAGLAINITQDRVFDRLGTPIHPFARPAVLRVTGPYRWTRNPMYLGMVFILVGTAICSGSLSPWVVPPIFVWIMTARFIRHEEGVLAEQFHAEFDVYRARVRRWI